MPPELAAERTVVLQDEGLRQFEGGFTSIPNRILANNGLSLGARMTYAMLLKYAWQKDFCFPAQERIAQDLGITDRSVRTFLGELREHHLIEWKQQGLNRPNIYYVKRLPALSPNGGSTPPRTGKVFRSGPEGSSGQERKQASDKEDSLKKTQINVNVTKSTSPKRTPAGTAISETALTKTYGLTEEQVDKVRRLVDQQADVLGHRDRNHAAYVQRAAEAVRDELSGVLESALGDVKDTSHRKAIGSLPAYFTRVYEAMRAEATRPRLDFTGARRSGERTDAPTSAGDVMRAQRDRLIASITAQGLSLPAHLKNASVTAIAAWYDQAQRTERPRR